MKIDVLSLFPEAFVGPLDLSIVGRARKEGHLSLAFHDIREFGEGRYRRVDERPYGGGPGMVMTPGPIRKAIEKCARKGTRKIALSPQGRPLTASLAKELATEEHLILLCGHYEGIDERVLEEVEEISVGDVVLSNGLLPAMVLIDALARFLPGVVEGTGSESFEEGLFDYPQYAGPKEGVPEILFSGHHEHIERWRKKRALEKTHARRPELFWEWMGKGPDIVLGAEDLEQSRRFFKEAGLACEKREGALIIEGSVLLLEGEFGVGMIRLTLSPEKFERVMKNVTPLASREGILIIEDPDGHEWCLQEGRAHEPQTTN